MHHTHHTYSSRTFSNSSLFLHFSHPDSNCFGTFVRVAEYLGLVSSLAIIFSVGEGEPRMNWKGRCKTGEEVIKKRTWRKKKRTLPLHLIQPPQKLRSLPQRPSSIMCMIRNLRRSFLKTLKIPVSPTFPQLSPLLLHAHLPQQSNRPSPPPQKAPTLSPRLHKTTPLGPLDPPFAHQLSGH